ncbi:unnamed protein product, partial [marine sediment metagenome]
MILTDDFVFVHYPKTGGTFVAKVLKELFERIDKPYETGHMHATCRRIPEQ